MSMPETTHLHLKKPEYTDYGDVADINDNMDTLDSVIYSMQNVGSANSGKFMMVASDGTVTPTAVPFASGVSF